MSRLSKDRSNERYLPGHLLPPGVLSTSHLREAIHAAELVILAVPTSALRTVLGELAHLHADIPILWACKGFELPAGYLPHQVVRETLTSSTRHGVLSGPSFADEIASGQPAALTLASSDPSFARQATVSLHSQRLRIYSSADVVGVELAGALKNVIAIAAGLCDGLSLGQNARAALITRGLAEISRLGTAMGGRAETFMGLSGLGDLVLTCTGVASRNYQVGQGLAQGLHLDTILKRLGHVAEGVNSSLAAVRLAHHHHVEMPIAETVLGVLEERLTPQAALEQLMSRGPRSE